MNQTSSDSLMLQGKLFHRVAPLQIKLWKPRGLPSVLGEFRSDIERLRELSTYLPRRPRRCNYCWSDIDKGELRHCCWTLTRQIWKQTNDNKFTYGLNAEDDGWPFVSKLRRQGVRGFLCRVFLFRYVWSLSPDIQPFWSHIYAFLKGHIFV